MDGQVIRKGGPWMTEIVEGGAIRVGQRELVPLVRVTTGVRRQAFVGADRVAGRGWGLARLRPVAILERSETGERRFPIRDRTAEVLGGLVLAAFVVWLLLAVAARVARTERRE